MVGLVARTINRARRKLGDGCSAPIDRKELAPCIGRGIDVTGTCSHAIRRKPEQIEDRGRELAGGATLLLEKIDDADKAERMTDFMGGDARKIKLT